VDTAFSGTDLRGSSRRCLKNVSERKRKRSTHGIGVIKDPALLWIETYQQTRLMHLPVGTRAVYMSILCHFTQWVAERAKKKEGFHPDYLTPPAIERYLFDLSSQGYSYAHCKRVRSVITHFCQWFVDEQRMLPQNPARSVKLAQSSAPGPTPPRTLSPQQRSILQNLVKQDDLRRQDPRDAQRVSRSSDVA
jgi:site-specific recombinase XerD